MTGELIGNATINNVVSSTETAIITAVTPVTSTSWSLTIDTGLPEFLQVGYFGIAGSPVVPTTTTTSTTTTAAPTTTTTTTAPPIPYYVSNTGNDDVSTTGEINDPYATLDYALQQVTNQNTIYFREGCYEFDEKEVTNNGLSIQAYNNENVTFDGTRSIEDLKDTNVNSGNWEAYTTTIVTDTNQTINNKTLHRIKLRDDVEIWQLFHDRNEVINARFPSAQWDDETVYDRANWGHGYYDIISNGDIKDGSGNVLGNGTSSPYYYENGEIVDVAQSGKSLYDFVTARQAIDPSFDLTGSLANLNVGSFRTYTKKINSQTLDTANNLIRLSYDNVATWKEKHHYYYLENKLEFLNSENEWFFDNTSKYLYVWLEGDAVPNSQNIRAKVQSYSLNVTADDVTVENINFFGTTLKGNGAANLTVKDCDFLYSSCYAHMLDQINYGTPIAPATNEVFETQTRVTSSSNVKFEGCAFRYTDGDVIHTSGGNTTIEDCYFNYIDKTAANLSSVMTTLRLMGSNNTVKNNTFRKTGASSTLNSGNAPIIEYNDMAESGYLQSDGAMIHLMTAQQENAKIRFNWVHDTIKYGIRFDGNGEGFNGYVHHNIGWNCEGAIMIKGGELDGNGNSVGGHFVYNNTAFNSTVKNDIMVLNVQAGQNINYGSVVMNNLSETLSGHRSNAEAFEPRIINSNNFTPANVEDYLVNVASNDFRPINDSSVVDAGNTTYTNSEFSPTGVDALTDDIGALQYGEAAWQAGITWDNSDRFNFHCDPITTTTTTAAPTTTTTTADPGPQTDCFGYREGDLLPASPQTYWEWQITEQSVVADGATPASTYDHGIDWPFEFPNGDTHWMLSNLGASTDNLGNPVIPNTPGTHDLNAGMTIYGRFDPPSTSSSWDALRDYNDAPVGTDVVISRGAGEGTTTLRKVAVLTHVPQHRFNFITSGFATESAFPTGQGNQYGNGIGVPTASTSMGYFSPNSFTNTEYGSTGVTDLARYFNRTARQLGVYAQHSLGAEVTPTGADANTYGSAPVWGFRTPHNAYIFVDANGNSLPVASNPRGQGAGSSTTAVNIVRLGSTSAWTNGDTWSLDGLTWTFNNGEWYDGGAGGLGNPLCGAGENPTAT